MGRKGGVSGGVDIKKSPPLSFVPILLYNKFFTIYIVRSTALDEGWYNEKQMINVVLTGFVAGFVVLTGVLVAGMVVYHVAKRRISETLRGYFTSTVENSPSAFALLVQSVASVVGQEVAVHLKTAFLGVESVESKRESKEVANAVMGEHPLMGAILASFPALGKRLSKNPAMLLLAQKAMEKFGGNHQKAEQLPLSTAANPFAF